jgi:hypothetical protein
LAPLLLAARGAVFFNLSLLTTNFWAVVVGRMVFGEKVMEVEQNPSGSVSYPAGFLLIMVAVTVFNVIPDTEHAEPGRALGERHYEVGEIGNGKSAMEHPHQAKDLEQESQPLQPTRSQSQRTDDE